MSDTRLHVQCGDCHAWLSGTSWAEWISEHSDQFPEHRMFVTRSGDLSRDYTAPAQESPDQ